MLKKSTRIAIVISATLGFLTGVTMLLVAMENRLEAEIDREAAIANKKVAELSLEQENTKREKLKMEAEKAAAEEAKAQALMEAAEAKRRKEELVKEGHRLRLETAKQEARNYWNDISRNENLLREALSNFHEMMGGGLGINAVTPIVEFDITNRTDLTVEIGYISAEITDYPLGKYRLSDSPFGVATIALLKAGINQTLVDYLHDDAKMSIRITGQADGIPVFGGSYYKGDLGDIYDIQYLSKPSGHIRTTNLIGYQSILTNEKIALLRAYGAAQSLLELGAVRNGELFIAADTVAGIGPAHRKVFIEVHIKGALEQKYEALDPQAKVIVNNGEFPVGSPLSGR